MTFADLLVDDLQIVVRLAVGNRRMTFTEN